MNEKEVLREFKRCGIPFNKNEDDLFETAHNSLNLNVCDKCDDYFDTENELTWINEEEFSPQKDEKLKPSTFRNFDALCEKCYNSELTKNSSKKIIANEIAEEL